MHRSPRTRFAVASLAVVATIALAACGDDDDDTGGTDTVSAAADTTEATDTTATSDTSETSGETTGTTPDSGTGGGGEVGERQEYVDAAVQQIPVEDEAMKTCIAEAMVTDAVYAAIQEQGLTVEEFGESGPDGLSLDEADAADAGTELATCGELVELVGGSEEQEACVTENLNNDQLAEILALQLFGLEPSGDLAAASDAVDACVNELDATTTTT